MVETKRRIWTFPRTNSDDDQLYCSTKGQLQRPAVHHRCCRLSGMHTHWWRNRCTEGFLGTDRTGETLFCSGRTRARWNHWWLCPQSGTCTCQPDCWGRQLRRDQKICRHGRMRWTGKLPQLLYGFCQSTSKRCGYFDCRLCQIQI